MERTRKQYAVQLEDDIIERVDRLAEKLDLNRSQMLRNMIISGLEDTEILNKSGMIYVVKIARDIKEKFLTDVIAGKIGLDKRGKWEVKE